MNEEPTIPSPPNRGPRDEENTPAPTMLTPSRRTDPPSDASSVSGDEPTRLSDPSDGLDRTIITGDIDLAKKVLSTSHEVAKTIIGGARSRTETMAVPPHQKGGMPVVSGFEMIEKLGEGGMGVVFKAVQQSLNRIVALKMVKALRHGDRAAEEEIKRFRREALAVAKLNHPNIVGIFDLGVENGVVYMALEFVDGPNCHKAVKEMGRFPWREALQIVRDCALGLAHAYSKGIVHRDVKPANIILGRDQSGEVRGGRRHIAKVADLGLSRLNEHGDDENLTRVGVSMGTPEHMAPEQVKSSDVDYRADIYALGSTLHYLMVGRSPYAGGNAIEILTKKETSRAPHPRRVISDLPDEVMLVLDRMMAREKEARYQSYQELITDIDRLLEGEAPLVEPMPPESSSFESLAGTGGSVRRSVGAPKAPAKAPKSVVFASIAFAFLLIGGAVVWKFVLAPNDEGKGGGVAKPEDPSARAKDALARWKTGQYAGLADDLRALAKLYAEAKQPPEPDVQSLIAAAPAIEKFGADEAAAYSAALAAKSKRIPEEAKPQLESFAAKFPFSARLADAAAVLKWADEEIAKREAEAAKAEAADAERRAKAACEGILLPASQWSMSDYFSRLESTERQLEDAAKNLPSDLGDGFRARLAEETKKRLLDSAAARTQAWTKLWRDRDYEGLAAVAARFAEHYRSVDLPMPPECERLAKLAPAARENGAEERKAYEESAKPGVKAWRVLELLEGFEAKFGFSPSLSEVRTMREEALTKACRVTLDVDAQQARLFVDGRTIDLGDGKWSGYISKGVQPFVVKAKGRCDAEAELNFEQAVGLEWKLRPLPAANLRPSRPLKRLNEDNSPLLAKFEDVLKADKTIGYQRTGVAEWKLSATARGVWNTYAVEMKGLPLIGEILGRKGNDGTDVAGAPGWSLQFSAVAEDGQGEIRIPLDGGDSFVVGVDTNRVYGGFRGRNDVLDLVASKPREGGRGNSKDYLCLSWHGDVVTLASGAGLATAKDLVSVAVPAPNARKMQVAFRTGPVVFVDVLLFPLHP